MRTGFSILACEPEFAGRFSSKRNIKAQPLKALPNKPAVRSELSKWSADQSRNRPMLLPGRTSTAASRNAPSCDNAAPEQQPPAARADQVLHILVAVKKACNLPLELCRMERFAERSSAREKLALDLRW